MTSNERVLAKYQRKQANAFKRAKGYDRLSMLKWRYWVKVNTRSHIWGRPVEAPQTKQIRRVTTQS